MAKKEDILRFAHSLYDAACNLTAEEVGLVTTDALLYIIQKAEPCSFVSEEHALAWSIVQDMITMAEDKYVARCTATSVSAHRRYFLQYARKNNIDPGDRKAFEDYLRKRLQPLNSKE